MNEIWCDTWDEFIRALNQEIFEGTVPEKGRFLFRGQGSANYKLTSAFDRAFSEKPTKVRERIEKQLIDRFTTILRSIDEYHGLADEPAAVLALAQHHGLPTRLLDWTDNPYVAAFFAFNGHFRATLRDEGITDHVAIYVLDSANHEVWGDSKGVSIIRPEGWKNSRLKRQFAHFTISKTPYLTLEEHLGHFDHHDHALQKIYLPTSIAKAAMGYLDLMGITFETLFPDLEGAARSVLTRTLIEES